MDPKAIAYGNGGFVTVGIRVEGGIPVGASQRYPSGSTTVSDTENSIAFGNGRFVAGTTGGLSYSNEWGQTWQSVNDAGDIGLGGRVAFQNGYFFAHDLEHDTYRFYSSDGISWSVTELADGSFAVPVGVYGAGLYVRRVPDAGGTGYNIVTSPSGVDNWTIRHTDTGGLSANQQVYGRSGPLVYGPSGFVYYGMDAGMFFSADGVTWQAIPTAQSPPQGFTPSPSGLGSDPIIRVLLAVPNAYVAFASEQQPNTTAFYNNSVWVSADGLAWTDTGNTGSAFSQRITAAAYGDGTFVAVTAAQSQNQADRAVGTPVYAS